MQDSFWYVCQYAHCDLMVSEVAVVNTGGENKDCAGEAMVLPPCKQEIRNTMNTNTINTNTDCDRYQTRELRLHWQGS